MANKARRRRRASSAASIGDAGHAGSIVLGMDAGGRCCGRDDSETWDDTVSKPASGEPDIVIR